ncbi:MAG: efflux RND transporter periplasmic adaptor subunit [Chitinophagaceae bacterium]
MILSQRYKRLPLALLLLAGSGLFSCSDKHSAAAGQQQEAPALQAFRLAKASLNSGVQIPGELQAYQQVDLYAKVNSFVKKLYADVGTRVKAGQLLATLEAPELSAQMSAATSRLKSQEAIYLSSKATYDRLLQTSQTPGTISQNDLDLALARQKSDLAQLEAARAAQSEVGVNNDYLQIRAPFDGVITARNVSAGAYAGPSGKGSEMPLFTLQQQDKLRLVVSVPAAYAGAVNDSTGVRFSVKSLPDQQFTARVSRLAGALDNRLRAQRTEMDVENKNHILLPGMVAEVQLQLRGAGNIFVVPNSSVLQSTEGTFVIKADQQKAIWIPVATGRSDTAQTQVFGELHDGDVIIRNASEEIRRESMLGKLNIQ